MLRTILEGFGSLMIQIFTQVSMEGMVSSSTIFMMLRWTTCLGKESLAIYYAVKTMTLPSRDTADGPILSYDDVEDRCQEIKTLILLQQEPRSPKVLFLLEYFYSRNATKTLVLVTELLQTGLKDVLEFLQISEYETRAVAKSILETIKFIHGKGVVHRDIKEANFMFRENGNPQTLTLIDFRLARVLEAGETDKSFCGSTGYISPEMYFQKPHSFGVDLFSFGVMLFKMLSGGKSPWPLMPLDDLRRRTKDLEYNFDDWDRVVAPSAKALIQHLLAPAEQRLDAERALDQEWFRVGLRRTSIEDSYLAFSSWQD
ncbi:Calcium-dependent protein kinase [Seminavis robusta]|uniref:Calcium-dependent protein kinase n=1 Tax=Seminavis robusta TaxID=568900 RepID=A0A9N8HUE7_9STRA|nr:Calcium-dependent protein kinase [Seminavis robusta]|eukprot:Sro1375_g267310.1 Calcium-dependent protein kinase (315) ;mRNA; f:4311-5472